MSSIVKFNCSAWEFSNNLEFISSIWFSIILDSFLYSSSVNSASIYAFLILSFLLFKFFSSFSNSILGLSTFDFNTGKKNSLTTLSYSNISDKSFLTEFSIVSSFMLFLQSSHL